MDQLIFKGVKLTIPCDEPSYDHSPWCWKCNGTGQMITPAGETIIKLVRTFGRLAEEDHSHRLS